MTDGDFYETRHAYVKNLKKAVLMLLPAIQDTFKRQLMFEEEILMNISDMMMNVYILESTLLRVEKLEKNKLKQNISVFMDMVDVLTQDISHKVYKSAFDTIGSFAEGDQMKTLSDALVTLTNTQSINVKDARRRIADKLIEDEVYKF